LRLSLDLLDEMENVQFKDCGFIEDDTKVIMEREQFMKIKELLIWLIENLNIRKYPSVMTTAYIENIKKAIQDLIFKTNSIS
ncbi:MAG: hypothetical protein ABFD50_19735, partial [Smithella sp.]